MYIQGLFIEDLLCAGTGLDTKLQLGTKAGVSPPCAHCSQRPRGQVPPNTLRNNGALLCDKGSNDKRYREGLL